MGQFLSNWDNNFGLKEKCENVTYAQKLEFELMHRNVLYDLYIHIKIKLWSIVIYLLYPIHILKLTSSRPQIDPKQTPNRPLSNQPMGP